MAILALIKQILTKFSTLQWDEKSEAREVRAPEPNLSKGPCTT